MKYFEMYGENMKMKNKIKRKWLRNIYGSGQ